MRFPSPRRLLAHLALAGVVFGLCYGAATVFGRTAAMQTLWPVNAIVLAYCLRFGRDRNNYLIALGMAVAAMAAANMATGRPVLTTVALPMANALQIALAVWFMRDVPIPMMHGKDLRQFFLGAVVAGPLAGAIVAGPMIGLAYGLSGMELARACWSWLSSDMIGMAIVAPFLLSLATVERGQWFRSLSLPVAIGMVVFALTAQSVLPVMLVSFPLLGLAVLRDRDRGAALGLGMITLAVMVAAAVGQGPIPSLSALGQNAVLLVQVCLTCMVLTLYPMAALVRRLDVYAARAAEDRDAARADSAAKSRVLGEVGEQIRSPLTGVVTIADMLRSGRLGDLNKQQLGLLTRIAESGAEIEALSHELTALSSGSAPPPRLCSVSETVERAVEGARFRARRVGVSIEALLGEPDWRAAIDADHLRRLVSDALSDALDACDGGGVVRVQVAQTNEGRLSIRVEDSAVDRLSDRLLKFSLNANDRAVSGLALDRADLRRLGGDLSLTRGDLGGARLALTFDIADNGAETVTHLSVGRTGASIPRR